MNKKIFLCIILIIALFAINFCVAADVEKEFAVGPNEIPTIADDNYTDPNKNLTIYESDTYFDADGEVEDFHDSYIFMYDEDILYEITSNGKVKVSEYQIEGPEHNEDEDYADYFFDTWFDRLYPQPASYFDVVLGNSDLKE